MKSVIMQTWMSEEMESHYYLGFNLKIYDKAVIRKASF